MEQNIKKIGLINLVVFLAVGVAGAVLARYSDTLAGQVGMVFFGLGFLVMVVSYFQMRLEESEQLEKLEFDELNEEKGSESLFKGDESEVFPARRSREQFERFFVPGFTILLFLLQAVAAYGLWNWLGSSMAPAINQPLVALSLFAVFFLILFLLGKYSVSLARLENQRLLRPGASFLVFGAYVSIVVTVSIALVWSGFPQTDLYVARAFAILLGFMAVETLLSLVLEIYRPRVKGRVAGVLYESRIVGILAQPESLVSTAAHAIDYQFGFKVSETWFYRFLQKALGWIILVQVAVLLLSTSFVFISPGEQGLMERFGRPVTSGEPLQPGLHVKYPWPIDKIYRYRTQEIQTLHIGFVPDDHRGEKTITWTVSHYQEEFNLLVASRDRSAGAAESAREGVPVDLLTVSIPVQYRIQDLHAWVYNHVDAGELLDKVATREVIRYLVSVDLFDIMSSGRAQAARDLQQRIQAKADELELGVSIVFVGLQDIHPPIKVAPAFQEINQALQENQARLRMTEGYAVRTVSLAKAEAERRIFEAQSYYHQKVSGAQAQAAAFTNQMAAFDASPEVFRTRARLEALERGSTNTWKYVVMATNSHEVFNFNLEHKIRSDLMDAMLPPAR
jgi:modulator of FtsH protease HflK